MVIGYARVIKLSTEEYLKIKDLDEFIYSFDRDGEDCYGGDYVRFEEERNNGLHGEVRDYLVLRSSYDKETDTYKARLRREEGELTLL